MRLFALSVFVVGVTTAFLIWGCIGLARDAERMERDPRLLRRRSLRLGFLYISIVVLDIVRIAMGDLPPMALIGVPITAAFAWFFIRRASNVKIPPP